MTEALVRICSNDCTDSVLVEVAAVEVALASLEAGQIEEATNKLRGLCPQVPCLPPFEIV